MKRSLIQILLVCFTLSADGAIKVHPRGVNVNTNGPTTVFLTFGGVVGFIPGEAVWCGDVMDAAPDIGFKPVPGTIYGTLPARLNLSTFSGTGGFTDIMSIPPSVARRAYQAAAAGENSTFFYVRRFISTTSGRDEYVVVSCRLTAGGARSPFALTNVELAFDGRDNLPSVAEGSIPPSVSAVITYTGSGQLHGRWEIVRPGDDPPTERDLLTEATLPIEQRGQQRRFTQLSRFSVFLPPRGTYTLRGPDPSVLPTNVRGLYMILLRIEASTDVESTSDLTVAGAGPASVAAGGVAGFFIPPLRYFVGGAPRLRANSVNLLLPTDMTTVSPASTTYLSWLGIPEGSFYRVVLVDPSNTIVFAALLSRGVGTYTLPPWIWTKTNARHLSWSVEALDDDGNIVSKSEWRTLMRETEGQDQ